MSAAPAPAAQPLLRTARLELWRPQRGDLAGLHALIAPAEVRRFLGGREGTLADEAARLLRNAGGWALYGYGTFHLRRAGDARLIGVAGVFHSWRGFGHGMDDVPEAGWILAPDLWGQGLAEEAMRAALGWFDATHGPRRIACMIDDGHATSLRLAEKLGFVPRETFTPPGDARGVVLLDRGAA